jgi:hypothetical protein
LSHFADQPDLLRHELAAVSTPSRRIFARALLKAGPTLFTEMPICSLIS